MAQILDKQGLQHYANKMCNADNRKVGTKSLPVILNELDIAIDGFKNAFEKEYGSPVNMDIINNQNVFMVGTGSNIDKKDDVENSFTDLKISGNSLINLMPSITGKSFRFNANSNWITSAYRTTTQCLKPSTVYTIILDIYANNLSSTNNFHVNVEYNNLMAFTEKWVVNGIGRYVKAFTTKSNLTEDMIVPRTQIEKAEEGKYVDYSIILLEGDWTNKSIPEYFEGLKSIGEQKNNNHKIDIWSENKNLWKLDKIRTQDGAIPLYTKNHNEIVYTSIGEFGIYSPIKVKTGQTLKISGIVENVQNIRLFKQVDKFQGGGVYTKDFNGVKTEVSPTYSYTFTEDGIYHIRIWCKSTGQAKLVNFLAEISNNNTEYDKYRSDNKILSLKQPLRGLPNGVKDTIEKVNGEWKIIRRCGEVIFNGSQTVTGTSNLTINSTWSKFGYQLGDCKDYSNVICDSLAYQTDKSGVNPDLRECVGSTNNMWKILFQIKKNNNMPSTVAEVNDYMKKNPKKIIYELINPTIEDIDPITLQCWKNGTISIVDEVIPVETTHTVALNKSAQIQKNIEELTSLRNRVKMLEEQYNKIALNQAYETELLKLDMKLDDII